MDGIIPEITPATKVLDAVYYIMLEGIAGDYDQSLRTIMLLASGAAALLGLALCFFG